MIQALSEILVDYGLCETHRKATNAIKRGEVFVEGLRVANEKALLVLVDDTRVCVGDVCRTIDPYVRSTHGI